MPRPLAAITMAATLAVSVGTAAQSTVERGKDLVESIMGCGNHHTPQGPNGPALDRALSGGPPIVEGNPLKSPMGFAYCDGIPAARHGGAGRLFAQPSTPEDALTSGANGPLG